MRPLTTYNLIAKRITDDWKLLLSVFVGITVAASLLAGAPVYLRTLERQSINIAIERADQTFLNIFAFGAKLPLNRDSLDGTATAIDESIADRLSEVYRGSDRYLKTSTFLVGTPRNPMSTEYGSLVSQGYFQQFSNLNDHVTWRSGRMASDEVTSGPDGPRLEGVISTFTSSAFGIDAGDQIVFASSISDPVRVTVDIVGVLEPVDKSDEYWRDSANRLLAPQPLNEPVDPGVVIDAEDPPLALFTSYEGMIAGVGKAYPGILIRSDWLIYIDKQGLTEWSKGETQDRLSGFESDASNVIQGTAVLTGINKLLSDFERRSFFSSVPLLLLLAVMVITVLYYVSMLVSYLVRSREDDIALLTSRGVTIWQLARLYALEGLSIMVMASVIAPFLAMGAVAAAGKLPYFSEITNGALLPVELRWTPFIVAAGTGLLGLAIYVVPVIVGAKTGFVAHKMRASRPPTAPFFQRLYLDIGLMVVGGLIFWELHSRGQLVSGGLFSDVQVNEALLLAPVLLLTVVALLFTRLFPLVVRFFSGDSPALIHLLAGASLAMLVFTTAIRNLSDDINTDWLWKVALISGIGILYYATNRAQRNWKQFAGLIAQGALIALLIYTDTPARDDTLYLPTIIAALLVPLQVAFVIMQRLNRAYPVWASMAIWHMARNPLQYSWLVLLLVMVTGLGILATTVGGTLDRSYEERILYEVGSDLRVTAAPRSVIVFNERLTSQFQDIPGVESISQALRKEGVIGINSIGNSFGLLAVESDKFPEIAWYRDDFSSQSLNVLMQSLKSDFGAEIAGIPEGAIKFQLWANAKDHYPNVFIRLVVQDSQGTVHTLSMGRMPAPGWTLMEAKIPPESEWPLNLISVQIYEPVFGSTGTQGSVLLDDLQVEFDNGRGPQILDDFEGENEWIPLSTSVISSDAVAVTSEAQHSGLQSGAFTFGKDSDQGVREFYRGPSGGPVPVIVSATFASANGTRVGDSLIINISGRLLPVRIVNTVDYFPTMDPSNNGFMIVDLDSALRYLNSRDPTSKVWPNELFISEAEDAQKDDVRRMALRLAPTRDLVRDRASLLEGVRLDPLITAGWKAMVLVAVGVILFVATLGYATYLISFADQSRSEMGFLQALGLTKRQMAWLLSAEHLVIAGLGLLIGTVAGFAMSGMMVNALAVTERGEAVLPPLAVTTNWAIMGPIYIVLGVIFIVSLIWLTRTTSKIDLHEISRGEGD
jgi:ABC-type antimicrobial peptide transport system permease subunit